MTNYVGCMIELYITLRRMQAIFLILSYAVNTDNIRRNTKRGLTKRAE